MLLLQKHSHQRRSWLPSRGARKVGEPALQRPPRLTAGRVWVYRDPRRPGSRARWPPVPRGPASAGPRGAEPWGGRGPWGSRTVLLKPGRAEPPGGPRTSRSAREPSPAPRWGDGRSHCRVLHVSVFKVGYDVPELHLELPSLGAGSERAPSPAAPSSEPSAPPAPAPQPWTWTPGPPPFSA